MVQGRDAGAPARGAGPDAAEARALLNRWGSEGFFRARRWGDRITVVSTRPLPFYRLILETQYERRTLQQFRAAYDGGPVDGAPTPPGLWEVNVPAPGTFESKRIERVTIPHTDAVLRCEGCGGTGRVDCPSCGGSGGLHRGAGAEQGCPACGARGWIDHPACSGKGRFRQCSEITAEFTCKTVTENLFSVTLPDRLLADAGTETLVDHRREGGGFAPSDLHPEMAPAMEGLWVQSTPDDHGATRILFQRYRIERMKGCEVVYATRDSTAPRKLWIVGEKGRVYAPRAPLAWMRVVGVSVAAAVAGASILAFLVTSLVSSIARGARADGAAGRVRVASAAGSAYGAPEKLQPKTPPPGPARPSIGAAGGHGAENTSPDEESGSDNADSPDDASAAAPSDEMQGPPSPPAADGAAGSNAADPSTDAAGLNDLLDPGGATDPSQASTTTYDVVAGSFTDGLEAQALADRIGQTAYKPTITPTEDANGLLYVVSIQGFGTQTAANEAAADLTAQGISAQVAANTP